MGQLFSLLFPNICTSTYTISSAFPPASPLHLLHTHHNQLAPHLLSPLQTIILHPLPQTMTMHIRGEITHRGRDAGVQCAAISQMPAETHACCADAAVASVKGEEGGDREARVFVIGGEGLSGVSGSTAGHL